MEIIGLLGTLFVFFLIGGIVWRMWEVATKSLKGVIKQAIKEADEEKRQVEGEDEQSPP